MWKDVYVRKWFGDFSQLMADSQFAVIALVLLASLGRVCLITGVTEAIEEEEERDDSIGAALKGFAEREVGKEVDWLVGTIEDREMEDDVGVVIARDDQDEDEGETVEQAGAIDPVRVETDTSAIPEEVSSLIQPPKPKPKKRKSRSSPTTSAAETPNPRKAKKKKLKKRDAIDDLFGNLL